MKNFYKMFKGLVINYNDTNNKNIASAPKDSYGVIIGDDGTKIDFFGGHSIESSQTNEIYRSVCDANGVNYNTFVSIPNESSKDMKIKYNYFPISGFSKGDSLEDSIFDFLDGHFDHNTEGRKKVKYISTDIKFKDLNLIRLDGKGSLLKCR